MFCGPCELLKQSPQNDKLKIEIYGKKIIKCSYIFENSINLASNMYTFIHIGVYVFWLLHTYILSFYRHENNLKIKTTTFELLNVILFTNEMIYVNRTVKLCNVMKNNELYISKHNYLLINERYVRKYLQKFFVMYISSSN